MLKHETGTLRHRLLAASVFAALLAQMALPALHVLRENTALRPAPTWQIASVGGVAEVGVARPGPAHDPAACPVCRTLMRTSPIATPPPAGGELCSERAPAPSTFRGCADSDVVMIGHPPRAPPPHALHLA